MVFPIIDEMNDYPYGKWNGDSSGEKIVNECNGDKNDPKRIQYRCKSIHHISDFWCNLFYGDIFSPYTKFAIHYLNISNFTIWIFHISQKEKYTLPTSNKF